MLYLLPGKSSLRGTPPFFGCITAAHGNGTPLAIKEGRPFAVDNECFTRPFDLFRMAKHLDRLKAYHEKCLFVVVPDIAWVKNKRVLDAQVTFDMFAEFSSHPIFAPWPMAYVAQNGAENLDISPTCSAIFIGGDTDWKLSDAARCVIHRGHAAGKWVHVGRVNTKSRIFHFDLLGVNSVDGTGLAYAPDRVMRELTRWLSQPTLFTARDRNGH